MPYPAFNPSARAYDFGDWPVRKYNAQNGSEIRLLYGNKRFNLKLSLSYTNITDTAVSSFTAHYAETKGTFSVFQFSAAAKVAILAGWQGLPGQLDMPAGTDWRYEGSPKIQQVRPGISTVTVNLIGVI